MLKQLWNTSQSRCSSTTQYNFRTKIFKASTPYKWVLMAFLFWKLCLLPYAYAGIYAYKKLATDWATTSLCYSKMKRGLRKRSMVRLWFSTDHEYSGSRLVICSVDCILKDAAIHVLPLPNVQKHIKRNQEKSGKNWNWLIRASFALKLLVIKNCSHLSI